MINQPVTIYYAKKDEMIPFMAAQEMYRYLKNFTFNEMAIMHILRAVQMPF